MPRQNGSSTPNTLFKYFSKSPKTPTAVPNKRKSPEPDEKSIDISNHIDSDEEIVPVTSKRKRIRLLSDNSDKSDEENIGNVITDRSSKINKLENSFKFEEKTPAKKQSSKKVLSESSTKNTSNVIEQKISNFDDSDNWLHCRLDFLKPEVIRDAEKRRPNDPNYDPRTLYVPADFIKNQTPAHKQWWEIKSMHYDCVLFFKVGKFYELFHMDAAIGVNELGFSYMKGDFAHSGFPESAYARMASSLVQKGFKVARVEQTETPEMMQDRVKKAALATKDKVVRREICQISCKGTEICTLLDSGPTEANSNYMLALAEQDLGFCSKFGICFIDASIGVFHLGQFDDDRHSSRLLTTLAHYPPSLILYEKGQITNRTNKILNMSCQSARKEALVPLKQFWSAHQTLKTLAEKYFHADSGTEWPSGIQPLLHDADSLGLTPGDGSELAIKALGASVWFLTDSLLDLQIMGMSQFKIYQPPDQGVPIDNIIKSNLPNNMVLDSFTINNLRIVGEDLSLFSKLDHCVTPMGKRLLYQWVCSPSCNVKLIQERQIAISYLLDNQAISQEVRSLLNSLPDMERLFTKIHSLGNLKKSKNHPDSRAILYEEKAYSKRKVLDFISLLNSFQSALNLINYFKESDSVLINKLTKIEPEGQFPQYSDILKFFKGAFDHKLAEKEGLILPEKGVDEEYDEILNEISEISDKLKDYLQTQEKHFNCKISYFGTDKKRYQLEIPESKASRAGSGYFLESTRKGFKRFSTAKTKELLTCMIYAEEHKRSVLKDLSRRIFEKFGQSHNLWQKAINLIATLDVLIALAEYARLQTGDICIPNISVAEGVKPFIIIKDGKHPCVPSSVDFIPNDTCFNEDGKTSLVLLTGPNMGGKSTLMRQLGLLIIMAQIGCHIPAFECSFTVVDRIFTRLGAYDDIMTGQSTFLVELSETAAILKHTTIHSLVLLDELGRGTSTYDGTAIASAVVDELSQRGCRTMFSTHYHTLVEDFKNNMNVSLSHMACMVEKEECDDNDDSVTQETVVFLYKLADGACPKSYGFNAARLAGISKEITQRAHSIAIQLEKEANLVAMFKKLFNVDTKQLKNVLSSYVTD